MPTLTKNLTKLFFLISIIYFYSCNSKNDSEVIKALDESIIASNKQLDQSNGEILWHIQNKLNDPASHEKALYWFPKSDSIHKICDSTTLFIENLKSSFLSGQNISLTKAVELFQKLKKYRADLMNINEKIRDIFSNSIRIATASFDSLTSNENKFAKTFFNNTSSDLIIPLLNKFENNIKEGENKLLVYTNINSDVIIDDFSNYSTIVALSTSCVKANETIEVTAGVGGFSTKAKPEITILNKKREPNDMGYVSYKFKASKKAGKHYLPVEIKFIDVNGIPIIVNKTMEYVVVGENQKQ